jgi:bleomycin hydrolase
MRYFFLISITFLLLASCSDDKQDGRQLPISFDNVIRLRTTPVKDQGSTPLCWAYAMLATIETEHIMRGDSIDLSAAYVLRNYLQEQALLRYSREMSKDMSIRGMITMLPRLLERYGAMPYTSYRMPEKWDAGVTLRKLQRKADAARLHAASIETLSEEITDLLDSELSPTANSVFMMGCEYTPIEFTHSIMQHEEYVALTSFTHHPWGVRFPLEVPDNVYQDEFLNVRLDSLMTYIDKALKNNHPVCWEGDVTEPFFDFHKGYALLENENQPVTQESRQQAFNKRQTTDDHTMAIIGIAHDNNGKKYYLCKNSWGDDNPYNGYMYLSENYVRAKTIAIMLPAAALPTWDEMGL